MGCISRKKPNGNYARRRWHSHIAPESPLVLDLKIKLEQSQWANMPPELLLDIIYRVEASETNWPARRDVIACASVCKSWREITKEIVKTPEQCGCLTFPSSLKQPGPRDSSIQCYIKRDRATSVYRLYFGPSPALSGDMGKLLLAARKIRKGTNIEFFISLVGDNFSQTCNTFVGKLKSNFLGTKFTIYDNQPLPNLVLQSNSKALQTVQLNQINANVPASNYNAGTISYELNVLRTRGPRRMQCTMHAIPISAIQEGGAVPALTNFSNCVPSQLPFSPLLEGKEMSEPTCRTENQESVDLKAGPLVLKNKAPRWHEQLHCWCLNFKGRVTVASVKNFQLEAATDTYQNADCVDQEKVILQFGKIGKDIFTMDYRYPLSAFQAFTICLSSFDTKPACE